MAVFEEVSTLEGSISANTVPMFWTRYYVRKRFPITYYHLYSYWNLVVPHHFECIKIDVCCRCYIMWISKVRINILNWQYVSTEEHKNVMNVSQGNTAESKCLSCKHSHSYSLAEDKLLFFTMIWMVLYGKCKRFPRYFPIRESSYGGKLAAILREIKNCDLLIRSELHKHQWDVMKTFKFLENKFHSNVV